LLSLLTLQSIAPTLAPRQFIFFCMALVIFWLVARIPYAHLEKISLFGYIGTIFLLILAQLFAFQTRNTVSWISVGGLFVIQPSQLAIPLVGLFLAQLATHKNLKNIRNFALILALIVLPLVLIIAEPDLGTAMVYLACMMGILFFSQTRWQYWAVMALAGMLIGSLAWQFVLRDYQKERVTSFLESSDIQDASYNARQSLIAVGSGQLWGRGLGQGVQSHLRFSTRASE
jgi:rod shape determining protein RodA